MAQHPRERDWVHDGTVEHYEDAVLYDFEYRRRRRDVRFYRETAHALVGEAGTVLELACGSGRITKALSRGGLRVDALDLSAAMLKRCRQRLNHSGRASSERVQLIRGDMRQFALGKKYPMVLMGFNSFEHLYTRIDVQRCLARVREHLTPDGRFVFDVQNPDLGWLTRDPEKRWAKTRFKHPETGEAFVYTTNHLYDPISQIVLIRIYYDANPDVGGATTPPQSRQITLAQRKFFPAELEALLDANGFAIQERYGDFEGDPLTGEAESQVVVCRSST